MKKILYLAIAAIACVACGENGANLPSGEKNAMNAATADLQAMIGQDEAAVDKALKSAGFVEPEIAENPEEQVKVRGAFKQLRKVLTTEEPAIADEEQKFSEHSYVYNPPADLDFNSNESLDKWTKETLEAGKSVIFLYTYFQGGKFVLANTTVLSPVTDKANLIYTGISDRLFAAIPKNMADSAWQGYIVIPAEESEEGKAEADGGLEKQFTDHAQFVAAVAAAKAINAAEVGRAVTAASKEAVTGFYYGCEWMNPTEEDKAQMIENLGVPFVQGYFVIGDINMMRDVME